MIVVHGLGLNPDQKVMGLTEFGPQLKDPHKNQFIHLWSVPTKTHRFVAVIYSNNHEGLYIYLKKNVKEQGEFYIWDFFNKEYHFNRERIKVWDMKKQLSIFFISNYS